ncbi:flagellar hook-associated protein FlgK [Actinotalea sp. K2]|uniref:flagellar hook-associated protein FlgK n=1 Tax=Actinotalea sp. K2 TaxID=2939438 RepID=UPI0020173DF1|nr:flagellar hook-associated protein FlgK [Actinotalea sp. K2]MCL3860846.1 flagellar hook-associated protein FlgK [Actinotalea sp. K2]
MSSFSGLSTALSSLVAQRQALEVSGQNISNVNTAGYTRQRANLTAVQALSAPSMHSSRTMAGNGVNVTSLTRMGDVFLDARVRAETSNASFQAARATAFSRLESTISEPTSTGLASQLQRFWTGWQDVGNKTDDAAARNVLLGDANALVDQIASGYRAVETQWNQLRTETETLVTEVNTTASAVARLNESIRGITVSGGSANELIDQRNELVTKLSALVGATGRERADGTMDVMVAGNALVRGVKANAIEAAGAFTMSAATADTAQQVRLAWTGTPPTSLTLEGGKLASHVANLAPDGMLDKAAKSWNGIAKALHETVNPVHMTGHGLDGAAGRQFFALVVGEPEAISLSVAITDPDHIGAGAVGEGDYDGSIADKISQLSTVTGGPDEAWRSFVVDLGVQTRAAGQRADVSEVSRATAQNLQLSQSSVDLDEEMVSMLAYQRAYEGAARVLTTIDQMLDVLINRTGVVGR